jgi:lipoprotein NlpD
MSSSYGVLCMIRLLSSSAVILLLSACSASQYAPVQDLGYSTAQIVSANRVQNTPLSYQVKPGDTMFAIAWRFGWDYKKLAKANAIKSPYTIYVGQVIYFNEINDNSAIKAPVEKGAVKKPVAIAKETPKKQPSSVSKKVDKTPTLRSYAGSKSVKWSWPLRGKLIQVFSNKAGASNGIDLSSSLGEPVKAASNGIIVYSGSGIQGYGKLVVVKHNDTFLSAYAYNSRILVEEGAIVIAGEVIAEVGKGPQLDPRLHFEIRKNGKPVNPLRYLPKL